MTELTVLCEGPSEAEFVSLVLRPHLVGAGCGFVKAFPLNRANFGCVSYKVLSASVGAALKTLRPHQFVTTMVDLYALPHDYPGMSDPAETGAMKAANVERAMRERMPSPRWIPYVQLHEFEALIYADLDRVDDAFPGRSLATA